MVKKESNSMTFKQYSNKATGEIVKVYEMRSRYTRDYCVETESTEKLKAITDSLFSTNSDPTEEWRKASQKLIDELYLSKKQLNQQYEPINKL